MFSCYFSANFVLNLKDRNKFSYHLEYCNGENMHVFSKTIFFSINERTYLLFLISKSCQQFEISEILFCFCLNTFLLYYFFVIEKKPGEVHGLL